jgi:hypothetical protein
LHKVERGKGDRYRNAILSQDLLLLVCQRWRVGRQQGVMHRDRWLPRAARHEADPHAAALSHRR